MVLETKFLSTGSFGCLFAFLLSCSSPQEIDFQSQGGEFLQTLIDKDYDSALEFMASEEFPNVKEEQMREMLTQMRMRIYEWHTSNLTIESVASYQLSKDGEVKDNYPYRSVHKVSSDQATEWVEIYWHQRAQKIFSVKFPDRKAADE